MKSIRITSVLEIEPISDDINVKVFLKESIKVCQKLETSANLKINNFLIAVNESSEISDVYEEYLELSNPLEIKHYER